MAQSAQPAQPTDYHNWQYFLSLENDLINLSRYIEFSGVTQPNSENAKVYSIELVRIFLAACAESENILKILAPCPPSIDEERYNIKKIKNNLQSNYQPIFNHLVQATILMPIYNLSFNPWQEWTTTNAAPQWWFDHNSVKHNRTQANYELAHLDNTLNSVAALMCLLFHYYPEIQPSGSGFPLILQPKLFDGNKSGINTNIHWGLDL
ncbi:MAG: hypothetical protein ACRCU2_06280 [Planktothrix sp.]